MEEDVPTGYKKQPLEDAVRAKRSKDNANILKASKATDTPTTTRYPYSRYCSN